jgi:hypothetical protein
VRGGADTATVALGGAVDRDGDALGLALGGVPVGVQALNATNAQPKKRHFRGERGADRVGCATEDPGNVAEGSKAAVERGPIWPIPEAPVRLLTTALIGF